jgi:hypothetical protein
MLHIEGDAGERSLDAPVIAQPFRNFEAQALLYERRRLVCVQVVEFGSFLSGDCEGVVEPVTRDQTGPCTSASNERVGGHRDPVAEVAEIARMHADLGERFVEPLCDRARRIGGARGNLPSRHTATLPVEKTDIGEGAPGIDGNPPSHIAVPGDAEAIAIDLVRMR